MDKIYREKDGLPELGRMALQETLFHNANGYLGVRGCLEEGALPGASTMRGTYINGFCDIVPMKQAEKLCHLVEDKESILNAADTQTIRIFLDEELFSMDMGTVLLWERLLDMDAGVTKRRVRWRSGTGKELQVDFCRMTSFVRPSLFTIDCQITPLNFSGPVKVESLHTGLVKNYADPNDPRLAAESGSYLIPGAYEAEAGYGAAGYGRESARSFLTVGTKKTGMFLCSGVAHECSEPGEWRVCYDAKMHQAGFTFYGRFEQGKTLRLTKYSVFCDSRREPDCVQAAKIRMGESFGCMDAVYKEQRRYLERFWKNSEIEIEGDEDASLALCFNLYQLLQSAGKDGLSSVAAKGLSGEGYEGHYFWDTEVYMMPFFTLTSPGLARQLLAYRYSTLEAARANAVRLGHRRGALYPWRTIGGRECSGYFPSGSAQYHINGAIAYAAVNYYLTTGDEEFMVEMGAEILLETARLWLDAGNWHEGHFCIHDVTGPDEYTCIVDNNYYTNACARFNMEWAVKAVEILEKLGKSEKLSYTGKELEELSRAWEHMYLPYDDNYGIHAQDDTFLSKPVWDLRETPKHHFPLLLHYHPLYLYRYQICKQADTVLAYCLFPHLADEAAMRRSYAYYEGVTTHDSSLSTCIFSIGAAMLGLERKAWDYFGNSLYTDLKDACGNTRDGIHTANMGGSYMAIVRGFAGLYVDEGGLSLAPKCPAAWKGYHFVIRYRGSLLRIGVRGDECVLRLLQGEPVRLRLYGQERILKHTIREAAAGECRGERVRCRAIVFDLDGVLVFTDQYHYEAWELLARRLDIPFDRGVNDRMRGVSRMESLDILLEGWTGRPFSAEEKMCMAEEKNEAYRARLGKLTPLDVPEETRNVLTRLRNQGWVLAVGSSSKNARMILDRTDLSQYFDGVTDGADIENSKPDPEVFIKTSETLGIPPCECVVVEDAAAGIAAAKRCGMTAVGMGAAAFLGMPDFRLERLTELPVLLEELGP